MNWDYLQPVTIKFGSGRISEISKLVAANGWKNGLLVTTHFFSKSEPVKQILEQGKGAIVGVFSECGPNPTVADVDNCAAQIRRQNIGYLIAIGGGSVMDCAKAAATVALTDDPIEHYHGTGVPLPQKHLPLIAVPTTSGTGSEVTCVSVLTNPAKQLKAPLVSDGFYPDYALVDPQLTLSMPPQLTACTGIDVLSHAVEGFWSKGHQPICDALAIHAAKLVFENLPRAFESPSDLAAREKMSEASLIAGLAFSLPKTTASHACSFPLTNRYHIPHGEACGLTLDYFTRINAQVDDGRLKMFANALGFTDAFALAEQIHSLKVRLKLRCDLKDLHLTDSQVNELSALSRHPNLLNNPVEITDEMLLQMYQLLR